MPWQWSNIEVTGDLYWCLPNLAPGGPGAGGQGQEQEQDEDWVAPHQNTVTHVDPHAPLAGLPPGEGNAPSLRSPASPLVCCISLYLVTRTDLTHL